MNQEELYRWDVSTANATLFDISSLTCTHFTDSSTPKPKVVKSRPRTPDSEAPSAKKVFAPHIRHYFNPDRQFE